MTVTAHAATAGTPASTNVSGWVFAWLGAAVIGVANGAIRNSVYRRRLGELVAHQVSTGTILVALFGYTWLLHRRWPLGSTSRALGVGLLWSTLTIGFEFGLGAARGLSWRQMTADYHLAAGRVWVLVPAFMAIAPWLARRLQRPERS